MSSKMYHVAGKEVFYGNEDGNRLVAVLDDDENPVFEPGMAGPHTQKLKAWMDTWPRRKKAPPPEEPEEREEEPNMEILQDDPVPDTIPSVETNVFVGSVPMAAVAEQNHLEEKNILSSGDDWVVSQIPDNRLPPFDKAQGVNTPGFQDFVRYNKLTDAQIAALVTRMEKR